ncbi:hypothetical protein At12D1_13690 [Agrobacterium tumefaciens]|nr:hypothetical protein At12D1_13690 [Agrobacterium tumefaciens]
MQGFGSSCLNTSFNYCASQSDTDSGRKGQNKRVTKMNQRASLQRAVSVKPNTDVPIRRRQTKSAKRTRVSTQSEDF